MHHHDDLGVRRLGNGLAVSVLLVRRVGRLRLKVDLLHRTILDSLDVGLRGLKVLQRHVDILDRNYVLLDLSIFLLLPRQFHFFYVRAECSLSFEPADHVLELIVWQDLAHFELDLCAEGASAIERLELLDHLRRCVVG